MTTDKLKKSRFTKTHRLIHWSISFTFLFLLLTVFLRMGWMNKDSIGEIVQSGLTEEGYQLSTEKAAIIGKAVRNPMWNWHVYAGYILLTLYIIRLLVFYIQGVPFVNPFNSKNALSERIKSFIYVLFYLLIAVSLTTGCLIKFPPSASVKEIAEAIHTKSLYYAIPFVIAHLAGLVIAELGKQPGIISKMISGNYQNR